MLITSFKHKGDRLGLMTFWRAEGDTASASFYVYAWLKWGLNRRLHTRKEEDIVTASEAEPKWITALTIRLHSHLNKQGWKSLHANQETTTTTDFRFSWGRKLGNIQSNPVVEGKSVMNFQPFVCRIFHLLSHKLNTAANGFCCTISCNQ